MNNSNFTTSITVSQSPEKVFHAINQVSAWWSGDVAGDALKEGDEFTYTVGDVHFSRQKVEELVPGKKVVWLVTDSRLSFVKDKNEWTGTRLLFDIAGNDKGTQLSFTHQGLTPAFQCYGGCSGAWSQLIEQSLLSLIETGKGKKIF